MVQEAKKSIQITRSFFEHVKDKDVLKQAAARYGFRLSAKLRESSQKTTTLFVYGRNSPFRGETPVFHQRTIVLPEPTNDTAATQSIKFEKPAAKTAVKLVNADNLDDLINLLHNEAKVI